MNRLWKTATPYWRRINAYILLRIHIRSWHHYWRIIIINFPFLRTIQRHSTSNSTYRWHFIWKINTGLYEKGRDMGWIGRGFLIFFWCGRACVGSTAVLSFFSLSHHRSEVLFGRTWFSVFYSITVGASSIWYLCNNYWSCIYSVQLK